MHIGGTSSMATKEKAEVLTLHRLFFGVPVRVAGTIVLLAGVTFFSFHWTVGISLGAILYTAMFLIHRADPDAIDIWIPRIKLAWRGWKVGRSNRGITILLNDPAQASRSTQ
jgi:type IV secretory pathway VirB3-like protein